MIFNSKQLEELENAHDSSSSFQDSEDSGDKSDGGDAAMEWRRQLVDEAAEAVKRAKSRPVDPAITYSVSSLLYDRESRRFGRVQASVPGYLRIAYLSGGEREYGVLDLEGYLTDFASQKKPSELAEQLGLSEDEVRDELEDIGLVAQDEDEDEEGAEAAPAGDAAASGDEVPAPAETQKAEAPAPKKPARKKRASKKAAAAAPAADTPAPAGDANPIDDPNSYIRQNYEAMSNREMARVTGLSEHTIRRKLGEWGLKRKKKPKK